VERDAAQADAPEIGGSGRDESDTDAPARRGPGSDHAAAHETRAPAGAADGGRQAPRAVTSWQQLQGLMSQYARYAHLMRLHRPIGIWLLLWPTLWAVWIAGDGKPDAKVFLILVVGTLVARSAGCVINDFADRKIDAQVARTANRPLATLEVAPAEALILFAALMLIALGLVLNLNRLTVMLAFVGAAVTVFYPFTKRFFSAPQFVLGVAFAWGVPMAFAAQTNDIPREGWLLFLAAVIWVVVYDTEYAMADRSDDARIGVRSTAILFGDLDRMLIAGLQLLLLATLHLVGKSAGLGGWYYAGLAGAAAFGVYQQYLIRNRDSGNCFRAFMNNAWLGASIFCGIALDYLFG
jgi:4-hydroxybenzoate polyprenyltransferase